MNLEISGQSLRCVSLDYAVTLLLDGDVDIRIATEFSLRTPSGLTVQIDPEQLGPGFEHIGSVLHATVTDAVAQDDGTLVLDFANGAGVQVAPHKSYEAWTLAGSRGQKVVVAPGGALSTWGRTYDPDRAAGAANRRGSESDDAANTGLTDGV